MRGLHPELEDLRPGPVLMQQVPGLINVMFNPREDTTGRYFCRFILYSTDSHSEY